MSNDITPPPELVAQWSETWHKAKVKHCGLPEYIATQAARWGADQQLEACCDYIGGEGQWFANPEHRLAELRAAMRPRPPSLKEQAIALVSRRIGDGFVQMLTDADAEIIRRALEQLP